MAFTWQLSEIRTEFRDLTGRHSTGDISDANCNNWINDYYQNYFPEEAGVSNFQTDFTQDVTAVDSGEYSLAQTVVAIEEPATIDGSRIHRAMDREEFFHAYPEDEHYSTPPTLVIGTSNTAAVANSAFKYRIGEYAYSKSATETALSGDAVPANKYGAWMLSIDEDGTISITEASDNATGYDSPKLAIAGLGSEPAEEAVMGFVTVIHTSTFTPGTTALSASGITTTFTDGRPKNRSRPEAALIDGNKLYLRPRPDDWYRFESQLSLQRPTALSSDSDAPSDLKWGKCIAVGAAMLFLSKKEMETERLIELATIKKALLESIASKRKLQWIRSGRTVQAAF